MVKKSHLAMGCFILPFSRCHPQEETGQSGRVIALSELNRDGFKAIQGTSSLYNITPRISSAFQTALLIPSPCSRTVVLAQLFVWLGRSIWRGGRAACARFSPSAHAGPRKVLRRQNPPVFRSHPSHLRGFFSGHLVGNSHSIPDAIVWPFVGKC